MMTGNLKGRDKKNTKSKGIVVKQKRGRKRRGKARTCDMVEGSRRGKAMRKLRRRKKGVKGESRQDTDGGGSEVNIPLLGKNYYHVAWSVGTDIQQ